MKHAASKNSREVSVDKTRCQRPLLLCDCMFTWNYLAPGHGQNHFINNKICGCFMDPPSRVLTFSEKSGPRGKGLDI